ncbi:hypothetical protein CPAR01_11328, partial [Colletotrichum paranaense]
KVVDYAQVQADISTGHPTQFNTSFHSDIDAPDLRKISNSPYSYKRWLTLILQSRDLSPSAVQQVSLTDSQTRLLLQACNASFQIGRVNPTLAEDLADEIAPAFSHLRFLPEGLFVRLDDCSPKAGAQIIPGRKFLHTIDKFILRIVTSGRFQAALEYLDLRDFAVPISKLKEQGKTQGALKCLDEFLVAKAGAKMSDLYSDMWDDCESYFGEQQEDAKAKGKMDWTPLPIEAPKTREEAIELRRISAKENAKDPTEPTKLYDIIQSNKDAAELDKTGSYLSIQVDSLAFETFTKLFGNSKPRKRIIWEDLEYSLELIGFSSRSIYGICTYFIADEAISELLLTIKHPYKSEVPSRTPVILARRLLKAYRWNLSSFS